MYIAKLIITDDDTGMVVAQNDVTFDPECIDEYGTEENVEGLVGKVMRQASREYADKMLEAEQRAEHIPTDFEEHNTRAFAYSGVR